MSTATPNPTPDPNPNPSPSPVPTASTSRLDRGHKWTQIVCGIIGLVFTFVGLCVAYRVLVANETRNRADQDKNEKEFVRLDDLNKTLNEQQRKLEHEINENKKRDAANYANALANLENIKAQAEQAAKDADFQMKQFIDSRDEAIRTVETEIGNFLHSNMKTRILATFLSNKKGNTPDEQSLLTTMIRFAKAEDKVVSTSLRLAKVNHEETRKIALGYLALPPDKRNQVEYTEKLARAHERFRVQMQAETKPLKEETDQLAIELVGIMNKIDKVIQGK